MHYVCVCLCMRERGSAYESEKNMNWIVWCFMSKRARSHNTLLLLEFLFLFGLRFIYGFITLVRTQCCVWNVQDTIDRERKKRKKKQKTNKDFGYHLLFLEFLFLAAFQENLNFWWSPCNFRRSPKRNWEPFPKVYRPFIVSMSQHGEKKRVEMSMMLKSCKRVSDACLGLDKPIPLNKVLHCVSNIDFTSPKTTIIQILSTQNIICHFIFDTYQCQQPTHRTHKFDVYILTLSQFLCWLNTFNACTFDIHLLLMVSFDQPN